MSKPANARTDVRRRTVLPTTLQNMHNAHITGAAAAGNELPSEEYLDAIEEELNRKVDADTEILVEGMAELVKMSKVGLNNSLLLLLGRTSHQKSFRLRPHGAFC